MKIFFQIKLKLFLNQINFQRKQIKIFSWILLEILIHQERQSKSGKVARGSVAARLCRRGSVARGNVRAVVSWYPLMIYYNENFGASLSWNLYNNILILCMWPFIDSAPGHHTDMRLISLEAVWQGRGHRIKNFSKK
jgi:hypothetical protein